MASAARETGRGAALGLAWAMGFVMWALLLSVAAVLAEIQADLGLSFTLRSLLLALPFLSLAAAAIPGGYLADRRGIRAGVGLGGIVAVAGAAARALPGPPEAFLGAAALFGVGLGLVVPNLPKLVSSRFPPADSGLATGVYSTGLIAGSVAGIYGTGPLARAVGTWRSALALWAVAGAVVVVLWWAVLRTAPARTADRGRPGSVALLRRRELWLLAFLFAVGNASYFFLVGAYPDYLVGLGLAPAAAVDQLALLVGVGIPAIFLAPVLSDRAGRRRPFLWGPHLLIAALLLALPAVPAAAVPLLSVGLGFAEMAIFALALLLPVDLFSEDEVGRASGLVVSIAYIGALLGPVAFGVVLDATGSGAAVLALFAALSLAAAAVAARLPEARGGKGFTPAAR